ncbi:MAG: peptidoglycan DD-metalloendopeptidase family protein [Kastovskya adunca ATA6-11-RM4]|nr:peptidoglycan DD-metalloendopeptidase family protein [Kastovskya adunca ATA6-11-RM4]
MKRIFTQKAKYVPSCAADSFEALSQSSAGQHPVGAVVPPEVNRRARTSAAMIGLAISMGASGILIPQDGSEAMAAEPLAIEPALSAQPDTGAADTPIQTAEPTNAASTLPSKQAEAPVSAPSQSVRTHQVQKGQTLWEVAKTYEVEPSAITASNRVPSSLALPTGQNLKIPAVNGVVHEVKKGETVAKVSQSYGVEPTQLQTSLPVTTASTQLPEGQAVTVPGNVNNLLKARQDVALDSLKEKRNRLNDSLAELRSEESPITSEQAAVNVEQLTTASTPKTVTLPPTAERAEVSLTKPPEVASVPSPVAIPVPTPDVAVSPAEKALIEADSEAPIILPVPLPNVAISPNLTLPDSVMSIPSPVALPMPSPEVAKSSLRKPTDAVTSIPSPVALPVPSPEVAKSPVLLPMPSPDVANSPAVTAPRVRISEAPVVIPVPTPSVAASPAEQKTRTATELTIAPETTEETAKTPSTPRPVVVETLVAVNPADVYQVRQGDTLDAIARRHGISRSELIQANGLNNPNLIRVNQQIRIPSQEANANARTVTLIPSVNPKSDNSRFGQESRPVVTPTPAIPTRSDRMTPIVANTSLDRLSSTAIAQSVPKENLQVNSRTSERPDVVVDTSTSSSNNHIDKLRADVLRLRESYRNQNPVEVSTSGQTSNSTPINIPVPVAPSLNRAATPSPVAPSLNRAATPSRQINPEFNPSRHAATLQTEQEQQKPELQQPTAQFPIQIEVPPPQQGLIASAPSGADSYNPALQTPVGQTVSPELPPLSAPDMYLPDSPAKFNGYIWPSKGVLTSGYGRRWGRMHKGIDIAGPVGTPIVAAGPGVVVTAGWNSGGYGNLVEIKHPDGSLTLYAHNSRVMVRRGQEVAQGQQVAAMGSTGYSTGPHLHFEVHPTGRGAVNPMAFLPKNR